MTLNELIFVIVHFSISKLLFDNTNSREKNYLQYLKISLLNTISTINAITSIFFFFNSYIIANTCTGVFDDTKSSFTKTDSGTDKEDMENVYEVSVR